jgi:hypothetical protein
MCWQCDNPNGTTEEYLDELRETIRINGWAVQGVEDDRRPFAYTIGLHDRGLPELLVTGLSPERAARVLMGPPWAGAFSTRVRTSLWAPGRYSRSSRWSIPMRT